VLALLVVSSGCDVLPRPGDTAGLQSDARWVHHARLVVVATPTSPGRLRLDTGVAGGGDASDAL